jgi:hypothetical protein
MKDFVAIVLTILFYPTVFLLLVALISWQSCWFKLRKAFPDQPDKPILRLRGQNGKIGTNRLIGVLELDVCPTGLRVGLMWPAELYWKAFFVPWGDITIIGPTPFRSVIEFRFGHPSIGRLRISKSLANQLAAAANQRWPKSLS